ncbi:MAG: GNAT family N-acetyltransferase [Ktedonobacteraceae bacterium]
MITENKQGLYPRQGLSQIELAEIEALAAICETYEHLHMKLNWNTLSSRPKDQTNDFLYYDGGVLVGFLAFFSFNLLEGEVSGMVHPEYRRKGIFTQLFTVARAECQLRNIPILLLIVEHDSISGQGFAASLKPAYQHSEYKMELTEIKALPELESHLRFRPARPDEAAILAHITAVSFDMPEQDVTWYSENKAEDTRSRVYLATLDEAYVGKLDVSFNEREAYIAGFGVLPLYQHRGYGRQILAQTIREIHATGQNSIVLEVATKNKNALSLYQSCGFREVSSYDYYSLSV